jgi:hypothetical protein
VSDSTPNVIAAAAFYRDRKAAAAPGGERIELLPRQIILWISISSTPAPPPSGFSHRFPVVLDTGFNGNLLIQEEHLLDWAGFGPADLATIGTALVEGKAARTKEAEIWLHRDQDSDMAPHFLEIDGGITVMSPGAARPRLPILGMRVIDTAELQLMIDGRSRMATVATHFDG